MLKNAYELFAFCEIEVAANIFSSRGKLYKFGSTGIAKTIKRYQQYCFNPLQDNGMTILDAIKEVVGDEFEGLEIIITMLVLKRHLEI